MQPIRNIAIALAMPLALGFGVTACDSKSSPTPAPGSDAVSAPQVARTDHTEVCDACQEAAKFHYSPFYVAVHDGEHYHTITFKDVGLERSDDGPDQALLEVIAESVSQELSNGELGYATEVGYDLALADPANHKACGANHIYVDVWNKGADTYGYSLWSGCGEDDNFSWKEVKIDASEDTKLYEHVAPMARSIHDDLKRAETTRCFTRKC